MNDTPRDSGQDRIALLQTFLRVAEAGSFSAAAALLDTTQPTVSRRVQQLEDLLGARLVERSTRGLRLTEEGERCIVQARALLDRWCALADDAAGDGAALRGTLRLRVPHAFGQGQLMAPLELFLKQHPQVSVEWMLNDQLPDFSREPVDCSLIVGQVERPNLVAVQLAEVPRLLVAAPSVAALLPEGLDRSPATLRAALSTLPWLALTTFYRDAIELVPDAGGEPITVPFHPRMGTDSVFALIDGARRGLGVTLVSEWAVLDDLAGGRLVRLLPGWGASPLPISLVYPTRQLQPPRLRAFVALMREVVPTLPGMRAVRRG
ncbi:LysR family transcriptional regulator [Rhizobacter sp. LjRoot28]|uniref:LysR family transcriptional regulator n=1 Tax=Rhizobacter sp. LjRoot28 TaxID=3342309 RepID=UPI003ED13BD2